MILRRDWEESASSHVEKYDDLRLEAGKRDSVILVHAHGSQTFIRTADSTYIEDRYEIGVGDLFELIKTHGKKLKRV
jgi:hypothetical protein